MCVSACVGFTVLVLLIDNGARYSLAISAQKRMSAVIY